MDWLAHSLELNPIENLWGRLVRDVYAKRRQLTTVQDLRLQFEQTSFSLKSEY